MPATALKPHCRDRVCPHACRSNTITEMLCCVPNSQAARTGTKEKGATPQRPQSDVALLSSQQAVAAMISTHDYGLPRSVVDHHAVEGSEKMQPEASPSPGSTPGRHAHCSNSNLMRWRNCSSCWQRCCTAGPVRCSPSPSTSRYPALPFQPLSSELSGPSSSCQPPPSMTAD